MSENEANITEKSEVSSAPPAAKKSNALPLAAGGVVFIVFVLFFSIKFGIFSSSNVTPQSAPAHEQDKPTVHEAEESYSDDPYSSLFEGLDDDDYSGDEGYYGDESEGMSEEDSIKQVAWYEAQKQEIKEERLQLEREIVRLQQLQDETEFLLERRAALEDVNLAAMAKLYENMKSEELVPILSNLDNSQVSLIISKMKRQKASDVLSKLPPKRAAKITQWLISLEPE